MQISSSTSSPRTTSGASSGNDVARLQKQLRELTDELGSVAGQDMDAKAKQEKVKILQAQIQMVQQQISAIQRQNQQEQANKLQQAQDAKNADTQATPARGKTPGLGDVVDTFA